MAAPGAKLILFMKAFREGRAFAGEEEMRRHVAWVKTAFAGRFDLEGHAATYLNAGGKRDDANPLPGIVFRLTKGAAPARR